jgi:hypothetical protein
MPLITRQPGWVILIWVVVAAVTGMFAPNLTRLAAERRANLLNRDSESFAASEALRIAWPDQAYESLVVAALLPITERSVPGANLMVGAPTLCSSGLPSSINHCRLFPRHLKAANQRRGWRSPTWTRTAFGLAVDLSKADSASTAEAEGPSTRRS